MAVSDNPVSWFRLGITAFAVLFLISSHSAEGKKKCNPGSVSKSDFRVMQDPSDPHKMISLEGVSEFKPYFHIGRSAYLLLDPECAVDDFLDDACKSGADTLRIFLTGDWRSIRPWNVNPWRQRPGTIRSEGDPQKPWWNEFDESENGYWNRLDKLLMKMNARNMVAELCLFDHATFARLESEYPGESVPFFHRMGSEMDDGRLVAFLDRLLEALNPHGNVIIEIGNQITTAWFRHEVIRNTKIVMDFAPRRDDRLHCSLWMKDIADYLRENRRAGTSPPITNSSRFAEDHFFELTLTDGWNCPVSFHSGRMGDWWKWNWKAMIGRKGRNSGMYLRYPFPFIDNEPMKFSDEDYRGLASSDAEKFRFYAWISAMAGVYHTYHSKWGSLTVPDRELTPEQCAGAAYLPIFSQFVKNTKNEFHRLHPRPGTIRHVEPKGVETFAAVSEHDEIIAVYLIRSGNVDDVRLRFRLPLENYDIVLFQPASGKQARIYRKENEPGNQLRIPVSAWKSDDLLVYEKKKK